MTISLSTFAAQLLNMVPEADTELKAIVRNQHIKQAVSDYGRDKPLINTTDITGDGGKYYSLAAVTTWAETFSQVQSVQYPAPTIASDETPIYLDSSDYDQAYLSGGVRYLWLPSHAPSAAETIRITFTSLYAWSAGSTTTSVIQVAHGFSLNDYIYQDDDEIWIAAGAGSGDLLATHQATTITDSDNFVATELAVDVPVVDFFAVCNKAACLACQSLAERFSRSSDSLIRADSVNHISKAGEFSERAKEFCKLYDDHIKATGGDSSGDSTSDGHAEFVDLDVSPMYPSGRRFLHHNRDSR